MNLVIVESAAKAKIIQKYLNEIPELKKFGGRFVVVASFGHISDLPRKELGITKGPPKWSAKYVPLEAKTKVIKGLEREIKKASHVWIASDLDMEGEAIANHIKTMFHLKKTDYSRITFNEITKSALRDAVLHPRSINMNMVDAQEARRILDRVIGYEVSPLLWRRFATAGLSAGRVQSAALKMVVDKEAEIKKHEPSPYWELHGEFSAKGGHVLPAKADGQWETASSVKKAITVLSKRKTGWTAKFTQREARRNPSAPFVTSSLQQEAYARLGLPAKRTMQIAQSLYESGWITYMRTDSPVLSQQAQTSIVSYITDKYGEKYVQAKQYKAKAANAQEAHECIRPADVTADAKELQGISRKLYDLIWRRAIASQMSPAIYTEYRYVIEHSASSPDVTFKGQYDVLVEQGFLKVYDPSAKVGDQKSMAIFMKDEAEVVPASMEAKGDVTRPPPLYNEPMLIRALEKEGIGRPSTYASIIDKLFHRGYVLKGVNPHSKTVHATSFKWNGGSGGIVESDDTIVVGGSDTDKFVATSLGERVVEYMEDIVPFLLEKKFTADMEQDLDDISDGKKNKDTILNEFYKPFSAAVSKAVAESKKKRKEANGNKKNKDDDIAPAKKNVLREFERIGANVIQTRYGPALFKKSEEKWVSLMPFLRWREKTIEEITERDARFLLSLPLPLGGYVVHMGRYGLYVKDGAGNNIRLAKTEWDAVYDGRLNDVSIEPLYKKK